MLDKPIPWNEVAYLAFDGDRPCLICRLLDEDETEADLWSDAEADREKILDRMREFRWELHKVEDAKRIFCDSIAERKKNHHQPLEGQKELFA